MADQEIARLIIKLTAESAELKTQLQQVSSQMKTHVSETKVGLAEIKQAWLKTVAEIYAAYRVLTTALSWAEVGAQAKQVEESFATVTKSMGVNGDALIAKMKEVGYVFVESTDLMIKAQRLLVEGVTPEQIVKLMEAARVASRLMAIDVAKAFDLISESVITLRTRGLRQAFPMVEEEVWKRYATTINTTSQYLNELGKRHAIVNEIIRMGDERYKIFGERLDPTTLNKIEKLKSGMAELKEEIGKVVSKTVELTASLYDLVDKAGKKLADYLIGLGMVTGVIKRKPREEPSEARYVAEYQAGALARAAAEAQAKKEKEVTDKYAEDISRLKLEYAKKTADELVKITEAGAEQEMQAALRAAVEQGLDVDRVEREWAIKTINARLAAELTAIKTAQTQAIEETRAKGLLTGATELAINETFNKQKIAAEMKANAEIMKIDVEDTKARVKAIQEALKFPGYEAPGAEEVEMRALAVRAKADAMALAMAPIERERTRVETDRNNLIISETESLKKYIDLEQKNYDLILDELLANKQLTDEEKKRHDELLTMLQDSVNKIAVYTYKMREQTGSAFDGLKQGWKEFWDTFPTEFMTMRDMVKSGMTEMGNFVTTFFTDVMKWQMKSALDYFKMILDAMIGVFAKSLSNMAMKWFESGLPDLISSLAGSSLKGTGIAGFFSSLFGSTSPTALTGAMTYQTGGPVRGLGIVEKGEFVQPIASVNYYGKGFMESVRNMSFPGGAAAAGGIPRRIELAVSLEEGLVTRIASKSRLTAEEVDLMVTKKYNTGGSIFKAIKGRP